MRASDLFRLALANVRRNRTRSLLTLAGVAVGVGALLTLMAYGAALQGNARGEFERLDLYNTLRVTSRPNPFEGGPASVVSQTMADPDSLGPEVPLTDSLIAVFRGLPGVLDAYPEVTFPVKIEAGRREVYATAEAVPQSFRALDGYRPIAGRFFATDTASAVLMAPSMAERLGWRPATAAVGDSLTLLTATIDLAALQSMASAFAFGMGTIPTRDHRHRMRIAGLLSEEGQPVTAFVRVLVPQGRAERMQKTTFFSTLDLMMRRSNVPGYAAVRVQLDDPDAHAAVRATIRRSGLYASSFRDQFAQLERLFLIVDFALAIVGLIALLVATLGIANTMTMNVVERRREIGVMKAVGGAESTVVRLFVAESGVLGLVGGVIGIVAGFAVMIALQAGVSAYLTRKSLPDVDVFAPSLALVGGVLVIALVVSLLAGLAPARRAARVEPVEALRA